MQGLAVGLVVLGCTLYAVWALLPRMLRRAVAQRAAKWPWPQPLAIRLQRAAQASSGCGCDGCDGKAPGALPAGGTQTIKIHRVVRR
jgi:hypothetical protein